MGVQYISRIDPVRYNTKSAVFIFFFLTPERPLATWQFILCSSRTLQVLREVDLKVSGEKQVSDQTPSQLISHIKHTQTSVYFSGSWDKIELWSFCKEVASLCIICLFLIYFCVRLGVLISAIFCSNDWQNAVPFVLLYLYLLLIHNPFTERRYFWVTWWTILIK